MIAGCLVRSEYVKIGYNSRINLNIYLSLSVVLLLFVLLLLLYAV